MCTKLCYDQKFFVRALCLAPRACFEAKMAEVVHRKLESMLPELEELERVGIFNRSEIRY